MHLFSFVSTVIFICLNSLDVSKHFLWFATSYDNTIVLYIPLLHKIKDKQYIESTDHFPLIAHQMFQTENRSQTINKPYYTHSSMTAMVTALALKQS